MREVSDLTVQLETQNQAMLMRTECPTAPESECVCPAPASDSHSFKTKQKQKSPSNFHPLSHQPGNRPARLPEVSRGMSAAALRGQNSRGPKHGLRLSTASSPLHTRVQPHPAPAGPRKCQDGDETGSGPPAPSLFTSWGSQPLWPRSPPWSLYLCCAGPRDGVWMAGRVTLSGPLSPQRGLSAVPSPPRAPPGPSAPNPGSGDV